MSLVLNVEILGEFKKLTAATQGAQNSLSGLQKKASGIARGIGRTVGALGLTLGFAAMVRGFKDATAAAEQAQVANDRIDAIAKSMNEFGNQAEQTTKRIKEYAESQSLTLGVDDEVIKATQAKLLTFRELTKTANTMNGSFDRATKASIDMAAAGFGSAESNAVALGKALNDPIKGVTALTRMGIQLTKEQRNMVKAMVETREASAAVAVGLFEDERAYNDFLKAQVKAGEGAKETAKIFKSQLTPAQYDLFVQLKSTSDMLGAQDLILKEIESQVGGTSAATVTAAKRMEIAFGEVQEVLGAVLLPILEKFSAWFVSILPHLQKFFGALLTALDSPQVQKAFGSLNTSLGNLGQSLGKLFGITAGPEATGFVAFFTVLAGILDGIVKAVDAVVQSFTNAFPMFKIYSDLTRGIADNLVGISGYKAPAPTPTIPSTFTGAGQGKNVTININKGNVTAKEIAKAVNKGTKVGGAPVMDAATIRRIGAR
jgi:hypothetical protein